MKLLQERNTTLLWSKANQGSKTAEFTQPSHARERPPNSLPRAVYLSQREEGREGGRIPKKQAYLARKTTEMKYQGKQASIYADKGSSE